MFKLLSFQPVSLYNNGGASRVLRRLYKGMESHVGSLGVIEAPAKKASGNLVETLIAAQPLHRPWMRWKVRNLFIWLRTKVLQPYTVKQIQKTAGKLNYDAIHMIHHSFFAMALFKDELLKGKELWVSFHDHFATTSTTQADTGLLWTKADRRLVISTEIAMEYERLFGEQEYEIITDGIFPTEVSAPKRIDASKPIIIYFSGLLHLTYYPLFRILADALDELTDDRTTFKLVMRGTTDLDFLKDRKFTTEYRLSFVSDEAIKQETDEADILYLPIKFNKPEFYLYSLSTKMVGYLGASGSILYHGPLDSAANVMLQTANAAVSCGTLEVADMVKALTGLIQNKTDVSASAKQLAREKFNMDEIRTRFWQGRNLTEAK